MFHLQGHDEKTLEVNQWVAVAYDDQYYIGKIIAIASAEEIRVTFLAMSKQSYSYYKWPKHKDNAKVSAKFIFCSNPDVQRIGTFFVVSNEECVSELYDTYKNGFMMMEASS